MQVYPTNADQFSDWQTASSGVYKALLLKSGTFNRDHQFVADLVPGTNEVSVAGYARINLGSRTRAYNATLDQVEFAAADPDFGALTTGQSALAIVVYKFITNDAASLVLGRQVLDTGTGPPDTAAYNPFKVTFPGGIMFALKAASGS